MEINKNRSYKLINKHSTSVLDGSKENNSVQQWKWHGGNNQRFLIFPLDNGYYAIANKYSGLVVDGSKENNSVQQWEWNGGKHQQWILEQNAGYYVIKNNLRGLVLDGSKENDSVQQWKGHGGNNQQWKIEDVETITLPTFKTGSLPDIPRFTASGQNLPESTEKVITAYTLIPCIMANDSWSHSQKIKESPYYALIKREYWKIEFQEDFGPHDEKENIATYGMRTSHHQSMEQTTGITVSADAGFAFKGFSASISTTVTHELKVSSSTSSEKMEEKTVKFKYNNPTGTTISYGKYAHVSEYQLLRMNGTFVDNPWSVTNENNTRTTTWPTNVDILEKNCSGK
jgi:hypothetical protein